MWTDENRGKYDRDQMLRRFCNPCRTFETDSAASERSKCIQRWRGISTIGDSAADDFSLVIRQQKTVVVWTTDLKVGRCAVCDTAGGNDLSCQPVGDADTTP